MWSTTFLLFFSFLPIDSLPILEVAEEVDSNESVACDEDEHAHDDEEALVDGHAHRLDEHGERGVLSCAQHTPSTVVPYKLQILQ